jgi:hypothetical protein
MAENPATWKTAELVISQALADCEEARREGMCGGTTPHVIADRLRAAGLLTDGDEPEIGWEGLRRAGKGENE